MSLIHLTSNKGQLSSLVFRYFFTSFFSFSIQFRYLFSVYKRHAPNSDREEDLKDVSDTVPAAEEMTGRGNGEVPDT
jgi:hypothetical protein